MQEERYSTRDGTYSAWHRRNSTRRFVGIESAQRLAMIDVDVSLYIEYDDGTKEPIALIETAKDVGQPIKPTTVIHNLAKRCVPQLPAYVVLYRPSSNAVNPADPQWPDIAMFRVRRVWPNPESNWKEFTPTEWASNLLSLRDYSASKIDAEQSNNPMAPTNEELTDRNYRLPDATRSFGSSYYEAGM